MKKHGITLRGALHALHALRRQLRCRVSLRRRLRVGEIRSPSFDGNSTKYGGAGLCFALLVLGVSAHAGRPLTSDDAGNAAPGSCQLESWTTHADSERAWTVAPACGLAPGWELGADYTRPQARSALRAEGGLALKWAPAAWQLSSTAGLLNFGLKLSGAWRQPAHAGWQSAQQGVAALATLQAHDAWALHLNLGLARDHGSRSRATQLNLALVWTPRDPWQLFAEVQANSKRTVFGGTLATAGARWWLNKDTLGLDLTAARESGVHGATVWTLGLCWYGIGL